MQSAPSPPLNDTIAAIATAAGKGGLGVIRVSGPKVSDLARHLLPQPDKVLNQARYAHLSSFVDENGQAIDEGLALYFPAPHSFTGEHVLELQGHGGPVVLNLLLQRIITLGARLARPGEFTERAFLNDKLDLAQAEAVADLIDAASEQAARCALRSLQGVFSQRIHGLVEALIQLRIYVEAAIDFPEEEIDFLQDEKIQTDLKLLTQDLNEIFQEARQGALLKEGMSVVIAGRPNAGKSSLLNALSGRETAIVTDIAGTTRDVLREYIHIDGLPLHLIDTAGLRESSDVVEQEGIRRAWAEIGKADKVLLMVDAATAPERTPEKLWPEFIKQLPNSKQLIIVVNKIDLLGPERPLSSQNNLCPIFYISAKHGLGLDELKTHLKEAMGYSNAGEGGFIARQRHLEALKQAQGALERGLEQLTRFRAGELLAEELREVQRALSEITGEFSNDDLLGRIFSSFCIGK